MATVSVNGTPTVFNDILLSVDGSTAIDINGYILSFRWTTGSQSDWVKSFTTTGKPLTTNRIPSSPAGEIMFAPGAFKNFYQFLNDSYSKFNLQFIEYATGNLAGFKQNLLVSSAQLDEIGTSGEPGRAQHNSTFSFKAIDIYYL